MLAPTPPPGASRRTVLRAGWRTGAAVGSAMAAGPLLSACTVDDAVEGLLDRRRGGTGEDPGEAGADADAAVLDEALALVDALLLLVRAVAAEQPGLARDLAPLAEAHRAHRDLLAAGVPGASAPDAGRRFVLPRSAAGSLRLVRAQEEEGARLLGELVDRAVGGPLARVLAVVAASTTAHLALLPRRPGGPPARRLVPRRLP